MSHSGPAFSTEVIRLDGDVDDDLLRSALAQDRSVVVIEGDEGLVRTDASLVVSLLTGTAFRCAIAQAITDSLDRRLRPNSINLGEFETALHEAITNAVIHGNLGLPPLTPSGIEGLASRAQEIEGRLADPRRSARRVLVACDWDDVGVTAIVSDEGAGFDPQAVEARCDGHAFAEPHPGRRGLGIMRQLASDLRFDAGGRCVVMTFPRLGAAKSTSPW